MQAMNALLAAVARLTPRDLSILVAVSGGPDSLCLLDALTRQAAKRGWRLGVACLDHGLRPESRAEAARVRLEAENRGLPFFATRIDVRAGARRNRRSIETTAREARYAWLARVALKNGFTAVATGHTADDQAETVLLRLLRGSGTAGLAAMRPDGLIAGARPPMRLLRPLLTTTRAQVEAYCRARGLQPIHDASNNDLAFTRNRIRLDLLPQLETFNPSVRQTLARLAEVAAGEAEMLRAYSDLLWASLDPEPLANGWSFDRKTWGALQRPAQRALLRRAAVAALPAEAEIGFEALEAALELVGRGGAGSIAELGGGVSLKLTRVSLDVVNTDAPTTAPARRLPRVSLRRSKVSVDGIRANPDRDVAFIDLGVVAARLSLDPQRPSVRAIARALTVRWPQPGDSFQPLGLNGRTQRLSDFFINTGVPRAQRAATPLVCCGAELLWVSGHRLAHWARVTEKTTAIGDLRLLIAD